MRGTPFDVQLLPGKQRAGRMEMPAPLFSVEPHGGRSTGSAGEVKRRQVLAFEVG